MRKAKKISSIAAALLLVLSSAISVYAEGRGTDLGDWGRSFISNSILPDHRSRGCDKRKIEDYL